jgi:hypothetical protein
VTAGRLPAGLRVENGAIVGTPTEAGGFAVTITATDADQFTGRRTFDLTVTLPTVTVTTTSLSAGAVGAAYSQQLAAAGGVGGHTFRLAPGSTLPRGLTLTAAGLVSGRPEVGGVFAFDVIASDSTTGTGPAESVATRVRLTVADPVAARVVAVRVLFGNPANPRVYELPAGRTTIPWAAVGIDIVFDKLVTATAATLLGLPAGVAVASVTGGSAVVRWVFAAGAEGSFALGLAVSGPAAVTNTAGTTGLTAPFARSFTVRLADVDGDNRVTSNDLARINQVRLAGLYDPTCDVNGDGVVDAADHALARTRLGR